MKKNITYKFRLYPNKVQEETISKMISSSNKFYKQVKKTKLYEHITNQRKDFLH